MHLIYLGSLLYVQVKKKAYLFSEQIWRHWWATPVYIWMQLSCVKGHSPYRSTWNWVHSELDTGLLLIVGFLEGKGSRIGGFLSHWKTAESNHIYNAKIILQSLNYSSEKQLPNWLTYILVIWFSKLCLNLTCDRSFVRYFLSK